MADNSTRACRVVSLVEPNRRGNAVLRGRVVAVMATRCELEVSVLGLYAGLVTVTVEAAGGAPGVEIEVGAALELAHEKRVDSAARSILKRANTSVLLVRR